MPVSYKGSGPKVEGRSVKTEGSKEFATGKTRRVDRCMRLIVVLLTMFVSIVGSAESQEPALPTESAEFEDQLATPPKLPEPAGAVRLSPKFDVWLDGRQGVVIVDGQVSLRRGMLELFACIRNTKEHESVVSVNTRASLVHAALLRLGAEPGHPVQYMPKFRPPAGDEIEVTVEWRDPEGRQHSARAQDWVRDLRTGQAMTQPWVFAGSHFWTDEETGRQYYQAEGGDFICVANFGAAMLDIPIKSSQSDAALEFEAFTERIPALGTPVRLLLKPVVDKQGAGSEERGASAEVRED